MIISLEDLENQPFFLFLGCMIIATTIEWFAGKILERMNQRKWWDYSDKKWNFDGYICLQYSVLWGVLGVLAVKFGDEDFTRLFHLIPRPFGNILVGIAFAGIIVDMSVSSAAALRIGRPTKAAVRWNRKVAVVTGKFTALIVGHVERRMEKAYPLIQVAREEAEKEGRFAEGCGFYKLFWLFVIGSLLGDLVETIFCRITAGVWMSRSSLVWGPFSIIWEWRLLRQQFFYIRTERSRTGIFLWSARSWAALMSTCAVFSPNCFSEKYSGITVAFLLIWAGELTCFTVSSGESLQ